MDFRKYINVIWLYAIGLALIFAGIYMIAFMGGGPSGFGFMVAGLMFSTIGGFYGKKKLMEGSSPATMGDRQMDMLRQNVVSQVRVKPSGQAEPQDQYAGASGQADWDDNQVPGISAGASGMPAVQANRPQIKPAMKAQPAMAASPIATQLAAHQPPSLDGNAIVKIMVCPDCNTENPPANMYCSSCGKRLRKLLPVTAKKPAASKLAAKKKASRPKRKAAQQAPDAQQ